MKAKTHELWNIHFIEQIIDTMADGVFTLDKDGRVTSWNRSMERISGYAADQAMSKTCQILKCNRDQIEISDLPLEIRQPGDECRPGAVQVAALRKARIGKNLSREELMKLLAASHWNKAEVARRLSVSRTAVWKYMKKWNIPLQKTA